jgi:predicted transcriptional regulator
MSGAQPAAEPDEPAMTPELDLASSLFHRIESFLPPDQKLLTVPPDCPAREAIRIMEENRCSRLPVLDENSGEVLGVFSYRSFARVAARNDLERWKRQKCAPGDLAVDEFLEQFQFARRGGDVDRFRFALERDGGILVGTPSEPEAILTCMDLWRHYEEAAGAFVMLREIELAVRELIRVALADEEIAAEARRCLMSGYGSEEKVPVRLSAMTFNDYILLVSHGDSWPRYESLFGGTRTRTKDKLEQVREIRNKSFHFRQDQITDEDRETLRRHRAWLLAKVKQLQSRRSAEAR